MECFYTHVYTLGLGNLLNIKEIFTRQNIFQ